MSLYEILSIFFTALGIFVSILIAYIGHKKK